MKEEGGVARPSRCASLRERLGNHERNPPCQTSGSPRRRNGVRPAPDRRPRREGARLDVIAGTAYGARSPVGCLSPTPTLYVHARLDAGARLAVDEAREPSRLMLIGGAKLAGDRIVWWNFVSSSKDRLERAKDDWKHRRFASIPDDDVEFIPLPSS